MINHQELFIKGFSGRRQLAALISKKQVKLAGNRKLKIYGTLHCAYGKRMKTVNRVFFVHEQEALAGSYRPCGYCMRSKYLLWKGK